MVVVVLVVVAVAAAAAERRYQSRLQQWRIQGGWGCILHRRGILATHNAPKLATLRSKLEIISDFNFSNESTQQEHMNHLKREIAFQ